MMSSTSDRLNLRVKLLLAIVGAALALAGLYRFFVGS
jgi:hypothetical protein